MRIPWAAVWDETKKKKTLHGVEGKRNERKKRLEYGVFMLCIITFNALLLHATALGWMTF